MIWVIYALLGFALFYVGSLYGVKECKKHYGIPKGCPAESVYIRVVPHMSGE